MMDLGVLTQCAWKGSVLMLAGFLAGALLRRRSAALRHSVWVACFAALLALPAAILALPQWGVLGRAPKPVVQAPVATTATVSVTMTTSPLPTPVNVPLMVWLAGAGAVAVWFLLGTLRTTWMVRRATATGDVSDLAESLGIGRRVRVLTCDATPMPLTWGLFRPVVVLPKGSAEWPPARLRTVLLHELVHVRRLDLLGQGIGQAACCLYWFHPLAWMAARQLRQEREQACDDAVLARGISAPEYAGHLMDLVRALAARRRAWVQAPAMAEVSGLEIRVRAMLDPRRDRRPLNRRKGLAIASAGAALLVPLAALSQATPSAPVPAPEVTAAPAPAQEVAPSANIPYRVVPRRKVAAMVSAAEPAPPQTARGSLAGTVRDPSGAVIPGSRVMLRNADGSNEETVQTDSAGQYHINSIPSGKYSMEVMAPGFAAFRLPQMQVPAGSVALVNANLEIGAMSEVVTLSAKRPPTVTPSVAVAPQRIKVGGSVQQARVLSQVRPVYPPELQQLGIEGTVMLKAVISKEGIPMSIRAVSSSVDPRLIPLAMDAVSQWRYSPTLLNGEPVETITSIDVNFTLDQ